MKKTILLILLVLALVLTGCNLTEKEPDDLAPLEGGELSFMLENIYYDPLQIMGEELPINNFQAAIYRGLFKYNDNFKIVGDLAEELTANIENNQVKFKLKEGVKWEDGSTITYEDILYSFEQYSGTNYHGVWKDLSFNLIGTDKFRTKKADHISGIELDEETNVITFNFEKLSYNDIEFLTAPLVSSKKSSSGQPLASGPFRIDVVNENGLELVRNENYGEQVFLDRISLSTSSDKANAGAFYATPTDVKNELFAKSKVYDLAGANYIYLGFNMNSDKLTDKVIRESLASVIKVDELITNKFAGHAERPLSIVHQDSWLYQKSFNYLSARDSKANLSGSDLSLELAYADTALYQLIAEKIAADFAANGVTLKLKPIANKDFVAALYSKGEYELFLASNNFELNPTKENYKWLARNDVLNNGYNVIHLNDEISDKLLNEAKTIIESKQAMVKYQEWQTHFGAQHYIVPLLTLDTILLAKPQYQISIKNSLTPYNDIANWWYYAKAK